MAQAANLNIKESTFKCSMYTLADLKGLTPVPSDTMVSVPAETVSIDFAPPL